MTLVVIVLLLASGLFSCLLILALCLAAKGGPKAPPQPAKKDKTMLHPVLPSGSADPGRANDAPAPQPPCRRHIEPAFNGTEVVA